MYAPEAAVQSFAGVTGSTSSTTARRVEKNVVAGRTLGRLGGNPQRNRRG